MALCTMTVMPKGKRKFRLCENEAVIDSLCVECHAAEEASKGYEIDETPEQLHERLWPAQGLTR